MSFSELHLIEPLLRAIAAEGYSGPTPIQRQAIPHLLDGRDLVGCARTGTGKTAAFALPLLQRLHLAQQAGAQASQHGGPGRSGGQRPIRVLVLSPTRELAAQIGESFATYGKHLRLRCGVLFGGVGQEPQVRMVQGGLDILVATPGRLLDLLGQKLLRLDRVETFVLDEADRMLDMGFIHDVRRVVAVLPRQRQTLLFSATMPDEIRELAQSILRDPVRVEVSPVSSSAEKIAQSVYFVEQPRKRALLERLLRDPQGDDGASSMQRVLVFTRTKHGANRVVDELAKAGIEAAAIHGNKSQSARVRALEGFKQGTLRVLIATDIAARGIDVDGVSHVINYDLPEVPESYVHRIGRTARAGASGVAIAFCSVAERPLLRDIERLTKQAVPVAGVEPGSPEPSAKVAAEPIQYRTEGHEPRRGRGHRRGGRGGGRRYAAPRSS